MSLRGFFSLGTSPSHDGGILMSSTGESRSPRVCAAQARRCNLPTNNTLCPPGCRQPPFPNPKLALQPPIQSTWEHMGFEQHPCLSPSCPQPVWGPGGERSGWAGTGFPTPSLLPCQGCSSPREPNPSLNKEGAICGNRLHVSRPVSPTLALVRRKASLL